MYTVISQHKTKNELTINCAYGLTINIKKYFGLFSKVSLTRNDNIIEITCMHFFKFKPVSYYYHKHLYDDAISFGLERLKALE